MGHHDQAVQQLHDERISTLARIKARSVDADVLTLTALRVLIYAQLEGGIKEQVALLLKLLNRFHLQIRELPPSLLKWRNPDDLNRFRAAVAFESLTEQFPFGDLPSKRVRIRPLNRTKEFNQMNSESLQCIYAGLGLRSVAIEAKWSAVDELVTARNDAAHHGLMPKNASALFEGQVRDDASMVELILTDIAVQSVTFFSSGLHRR
jgi:hypothetical protein